MYNFNQHYYLLFFVSPPRPHICETPNNNGGTDGRIGFCSQITSMSLEINGLVGGGVVDSNQKSVTFQLPFTSKTTPNEARLATVSLSDDKAFAKVSIGGMISFTNQKVPFSIRLDNTNTTYELKIINTENDMKDFRFLKSIKPQLPKKD